MKETIGFIGLGIMGRPMAERLLQAGYPLVVYNRSAPKMQPLVDLGALGASSCADAAQRSTIIVSIVGDTLDARSVYLGDAGVLQGSRPGMLLIDMSTISPVTAMELFRAASSRKCEMLDAPVSGGDVGARKGTLSIMVGGEQGAFERARPVFSVLGSPTWCGPSGAGQTVKACNQIAVALNLLGLAEALVLATKAGVDPGVVVSVLGGGFAQSRALDVRGPRIVKGDYQPGFRARLHYKDMNIVRETARAYGCSLLGANLAHELFSAMVSNGWGDLDHSALVKVVNLLSGPASPA
jgi:2-hydroxy-3-oxopropionate reductase